MENILLVLLTMHGLTSNAAMANPDLARAKNCMSCHAVATKVVGPAFKDVARRYWGQKVADDKLVAEVMEGSSGVWGPVPMPGNSQVSNAEAHTLVKWILSQK
jgi:cytochrome c